MVFFVTKMKRNIAEGAFTSHISLREALAKAKSNSADGSKWRIYQGAYAIDAAGNVVTPTEQLCQVLTYKNGACTWLFGN